MSAEPPTPSAREHFRLSITQHCHGITMFTTYTVVFFQCIEIPWNKKKWEHHTVISSLYHGSTTVLFYSVKYYVSEGNVGINMMFIKFLIRFEHIAFIKPPHCI